MLDIKMSKGQFRLHDELITILYKRNLQICDQKMLNNIYEILDPKEVSHIYGEISTTIHYRKYKNE